MEAEELCNFLILKANIWTHRDVAVTFITDTNLQELLLITLFYQTKVVQLVNYFFLVVENRS